MSDRLPEHARGVIIGGGIVGCSVAYFLVKFGWRDVRLLEQGELAGGTTWHAAGASKYTIEVAGRKYPARASLEPPYDPKGIRIRG
jgi:glycine/D-amino acid oxidase-like deaminating enzyme